VRPFPLLWVMCARLSLRVCKRACTHARTLTRTRPRARTHTHTHTHTHTLARTHAHTHTPYGRAFQKSPVRGRGGPALGRAPTPGRLHVHPPSGSRPLVGRRAYPVARLGAACAPSPTASDAVRRPTWPGTQHAAAVWRPSRHTGCASGGRLGSRAAAAAWRPSLPTGCGPGGTRGTSAALLPERRAAAGPCPPRPAPWRRGAGDAEAAPVRPLARAGTP